MEKKWYMGRYRDVGLLKGDGGKCKGLFDSFTYILAVLGVGFKKKKEFGEKARPKKTKIGKKARPKLRSYNVTLRPVSLGLWFVSIIIFLFLFSN